MADFEDRLRRALAPVGPPTTSMAGDDAWAMVHSRLGYGASDDPIERATTEPATTEPPTTRPPDAPPVERHSTPGRGPGRRAVLLGAAAAAATAALAAVVRARPGNIPPLAVDDDALPRLLLPGSSGFELVSVADLAARPSFAGWVIGVRERTGVAAIGIQSQTIHPTNSDDEPVVVPGGLPGLLRTIRVGELPRMVLWWWDDRQTYFAMAQGARAADRDVLLSVAAGVVAVPDAPVPGPISLPNPPAGFDVTYVGPTTGLEPLDGYELSYGLPENAVHADRTVQIRVDRGGPSAARRAVLYGLRATGVDERPAYVGPSASWVMPGIGTADRMLVFDLTPDTTVTVAGDYFADAPDGVGEISLAPLTRQLRRVSEARWRSATAGREEQPAQAATTSSAPPSTTVPPPTTAPPSTSG